MSQSRPLLLPNHPSIASALHNLAMLLTVATGCQKLFEDHAVRLPDE